MKKVSSKNGCPHFSRFYPNLARSRTQSFTQKYSIKFLPKRVLLFGQVNFFTRRGSKNLFARKIGYRDSYLDSVFCYSKVFRLHPILHVAAGAVQLQTGKGPGYCYMIGRGPNSYLLGHVTGLVFCFYVKLFLASIFISVKV